MSFRTKKRFGQHFLHDPLIIQRIIAAARLDGSQRTLEIGPGLGVLTERLLELSEQVTVMEIDRELIERLRARRDPRLTIHAGDVLKLPWADLLQSPPYVLVANLPYNISSQILFRLIDHRELFSRLVLMFQREVGERLVAEPGGRDYGILSVFCQLYFAVSVVTRVSPGAFKPPPRVDSLVLLFDPLPQPRVDPVDPELFTRVVKGAFRQRRKTLRNSLLQHGFPAVLTDAALAAAGIAPGCRGETLSLLDFSRLTQAFHDCNAAENSLKIP